jgi:ADP-ribose pyrophosphatase YjhB (NUDIX family)
MNLLKELRDEDVSGNKIRWAEETYRFRRAARAIIMDKEKNIAILFAPEDNYYKLPGGEINEENISDSLKKSVFNETGCEVKVDRELGMIIEYKNKYGQIQISYCFVCNLNSNKKDNFIQNKKDEPFQLLWVPLSKAIKLFESGSPKAYTHQFILKRDQVFLIKFKENLNS